RVQRSGGGCIGAADRADRAGWTPLRTWRIARQGGDPHLLGDVVRALPRGVAAAVGLREAPRARRTGRAGFQPRYAGSLAAGSRSRRATGFSRRAARRSACAGVWPHLAPARELHDRPRGTACGQRLEGPEPGLDARTAGTDRHAAVEVA